MAEIYDIDLLRALFVNKLNDSTIFLASFYEQIKDEQAIVRYVDTLKELIALQNQEKTESTYKAMGIVSQSGNANIVNITQNYIVPFDYQVRLDIELADRDYVLNKIKALISTLKGKKADIVLLDNGNMYVMNTPSFSTAVDRPILTTSNLSFFQQSTAYNPALTANNATWSTDIENKYSSLFAGTYTFYFIFGTTLYKRSITRVTSPSNSWTYGTAETLGTVAGKYKVSVSFNGIQSQEPYINNGMDRVFLFFGGSATVVDNNVGLGNDITLFTIQVGKDDGTLYTVEPTEIPASLAVADDSYQTYASGYKTIDRNLTINNKVPYTFAYNKSIALFNQMYKYARYGGGTLDPNQIYTIKEYRYDYGTLDVDKFYAKLGDVSCSNTNGDVMTLTPTFKVGAY